MRHPNRRRCRSREHDYTYPIEIEMQIRIFVRIEDGLAILHLEVIQVLQELLRGIRKEGSLLIRVDRGISRIRMKMEGKGAYKLEA